MFPFLVFYHLPKALAFETLKYNIKTMFDILNTYKPIPEKYSTTMSFILTIRRILCDILFMFKAKLQFLASNIEFLVYKVDLSHQIYIDVKGKEKRLIHYRKIHKLDERQTNIIPELENQKKQICERKKVVNAIQFDSVVS